MWGVAFDRRNGVVSVAAPRVATEESTKSEVEAFDRAMLADSFLTVVRAGGFVATKRTLWVACGDPFEKWGKDPLVGADEAPDESRDHEETGAD